MEEHAIGGEKVKLDKELADYSECTGCGACYSVCDLRAIQMIEDRSSHFYYPDVDTKKCIECGNCVNICPVINKSTEFVGVKRTYAANNKKSEMRMISASGGMFGALASQVISEGGAVAGVRYEGVEKCKHHIVTSEEGLRELCGTKYFQSESQNIYGELEEYSDRCNIVMFCGTPCQVDAAKRYAALKHFSDKLFTVEILCRGVSPALLHQKFIAHLQNKYGKRIVSVQYKEKTRGWNNIGTLIHLEDGTEKYVSREGNYLARLAYDLNLSIRESCYNCNYKQMKRYADITIGDFWGLKDSPLLDNKGTSFVMVNTKKGEELFEKTADKLDFYACDSDAIWSGNPNGFNQVKCEKKIREALWSSLNEGEDIGVVTERLQRMILDSKTKRQKQLIDKDNRIMELYERWIIGCSHGENVGQFLLNNGINHIAVQGFGTLGRAVSEVIQQNGVIVDYIIESDKSRWNEGKCRFYTTHDELPAVDAVIVTAITSFDEISRKLKEKLVCPILSMEDIVP